MADFNKAYNKTMGHEGGYSFDPDDVGGETYKGVARKYHADWEGWVLIDKKKQWEDFPDCLRLDDDLNHKVMSFYKKHYWDVHKCDFILDQLIAEELFDTSVNMGVRRAGKFLQESLNCLNRNQSSYTDIKVDGYIGTKTLMCVNAYLGQSNNSYLLKMMNVLQGHHYMEYMKKDPVQEKFAYGWFNRVEIKKNY